MISLKKIVMLVTNDHFPDDIRVFKEAVTLSKNFRVSVIVWDRTGLGKKQEVLPEGIEIFRVKVKSIPSVFSDFVVRLPIFWLLSVILLLKLRADAIHCHDFDTLPIGVSMKFIAPKIKVIFDSHEHYPSMISDSVPGLVTKAVGFLFVTLPRLSDGVIVVNGYLGQFFSKCKNVTVVMNTPPLDELQAVNCSTAKKSDTFTIFYFGVLSKERGIYTLTRMAEKLPNVSLIIAGDGPEKAGIMEISRTHSNIKYKGWISYPQIIETMRSSDLIPILYSSNLLNNRMVTPNKLFLAMSLGKPVVVSKGSLAEQIVVAEKVGFSIDENNLLELERIINLLLNDNSETTTICENGKKAVRTTYNWGLMEERLKKLYGKILKE